MKKKKKKEAREQRNGASNGGLVVRKDWQSFFFPGGRQHRGAREPAFCCLASGGAKGDAHALKMKIVNGGNLHYYKLFQLFCLVKNHWLNNVIKPPRGSI